MWMHNKGFIISAICISAHRIAPKLSEERARTEVFALILHELSHLLGTTEEEAESFQRDIAFDLKKINESSSKEWLNNLDVQSSNVLKELRDLSKNIKTLEAKELAHKMNEANRKISDYHGVVFDNPYSLHSAKESAYHRLQTNRFSAGVWYVLGELDNGMYWRRKLEEIFQGQSEVTFALFKERNGFDRYKSIYDSQTVTRVKDRAGLTLLFKKQMNYFLGQSELIHRVRLNMSLNRPNLPNLTPYTNPWEQFIGDYHASSSHCVKSDGSIVDAAETGFSIFKLDNGQLDMKRLFSNGWGQMGGLYDGAGDIQGGSSVKVDGKTGVSSRTAERGTPWSREWQKVTYTLEKVDTTYKMSIVKFFRTWYAFQVKEYTTKCHFDLIKN